MYFTNCAALLWWLIQVFKLDSVSAPEKSLKIVPICCVWQDFAVNTFRICVDNLRIIYVRFYLNLWIYLYSLFKCCDTSENLVPFSIPLREFSYRFHVFSSVLIQISKHFTKWVKFLISFFPSWFSRDFPAWFARSERFHKFGDFFWKAQNIFTW